MLKVEKCMALDNNFKSFISKVFINYKKVEKVLERWLRG